MCDGHRTKNSGKMVLTIQEEVQGGTTINTSNDEAVHRKGERSSMKKASVGLFLQLEAVRSDIIYCSRADEASKWYCLIKQQNKNITQNTPTH
mmetsp:Transcript_12340/g.19577  ORF Transcript_12340/g.19577 Transcript_12340/m.19577 type:complete len:93 (+) Transcript_12340:65-343(+)